MAAPKPPAVSGAGTPSCWPRDFNAGHIERRDRHWLQIIHHYSTNRCLQACSMATLMGAGLNREQLALMSSQPQADHLTDVAAGLSRRLESIRRLSPRNHQIAASETG